MYICICFICIYVHVHMYICMYVCMCVYVCMCGGYSESMYIRPVHRQIDIETQIDRDKNR